ncbi:glycosyltransferase family 9 protein [Cellulomonas endophytica]|uniref:glycosyltransferase family 9 protein n=1 Tax=Cellulomonas endophytica TaxID=2494735 RepID=UPI0010107F9E|nr:glycosyltransferase family 9 protein [Cellulomonas endophytica]
MTGDVLVLRALGLGDALTGVAALRGVRRAWPDRRVWLAGPAATGALLRDLGVVDEVLVAGELEPLDWRGSGHVAVNLHGRGPQSHRLLAATRPAQLVGFACEGFDEGPVFDVDEHDVERWCRLLRWAGGPCGPEDLRLPVRPAAEVPPGTVGEVVLHPGAAHGARRWPAERFAAVAAALVARGLRVAVTGSPDEAPLCAAVVGGARAALGRSRAEGAGAGGRRSVGGTGSPADDGAAGLVDLCGRLDLGALVRRIAGARLLVCGDTGVAHVATAVGTPSVLLFGPVPPDLWRPLVDVERHAVLWHGVPGQGGDGTADTLHPALAAVTVEEVLVAADDLLARAPAAVPSGAVAG